MINSCVRCGTKIKGFFKICGMCQQTVDIERKPKVIERDEEDDKK